MPPRRDTSFGTRAPDRFGQHSAGASCVYRIRSRWVAATAELRASEADRTLFETVDVGFCVVELLFDDDHQPLDYRFIEANPAFERQTSLVGAIGRTARELVPDLEPHWFELYGRVALTGETLRFEHGSSAMGRWFDVHALRVGDPQSRRIALLINDVSERRPGTCIITAGRAV